MKDKYSAVWVSHSSISDYLRCPRAYYLRNVYRDPKTNHKISVIEPPLALGQAVHEVLDRISIIPAEKRFERPLTEILDEVWQAVAGDKGGFINIEEEDKFKQRAVRMMQNIMDNPGPVSRKAVKIRHELPYYWLSEEENIILCGKIDWLEYVEDTDSVRIIDFKTGKFDEDKESLQLPIYYLLASNVQNRKVTGISYWYLDRDTDPYDMELPDPDQANKRVLEAAKKIALARKLGHFKCRENGCRACRPLEAVVAGNARKVGVNDFGQDIYITDK